MSKIIKNQRGYDNLIIDNYIHEKRRTIKSTITWYCTQYRITRCPATVKTDLENNVQSIKGQHNHEPLTDAHIIFKEARTELHKKACSELRQSSGSLCIREVDAIVKKHEMTIDQEVALASKLIYNHPPSLRYHRRKTTPALPKTIESIELPESYTKCSSKQTDKSSLDFVIHQDENMLVFASPTGIEILNESDSWGCDGTFQVAPVPFLQLYIITAKVYEQHFAVVFALLKNKRQCTYKVLANTIRGLVNNDPKRIMLDFECKY